MERNLRLNWQELVKEAIKRRKEQRLTQEKLAALAGVSKPTLISFEKGRVSLEIGSAMKVLRVLGMGERQESWRE